MAGQVAAGVGGAVGAAAIVNMTPIADNRTKALAAMAGGLGAWLLLPKKQKLLRAASVGATLGGALALTKQMFPQLPLMAGEPYYMGVNMRATYPRQYGPSARRQMYQQRKIDTFRESTRSGRNAQFAGTMGGAGANRMSAGVQFGKFLTPADM